MYPKWNKHHGGNCLCAVHKSMVKLRSRSSTGWMQLISSGSKSSGDSLPGDVLGVREPGKAGLDKARLGCPVVPLAAWRGRVRLCHPPLQGRVVGRLHLWLLAGCRLCREWRRPSAAAAPSPGARRVRGTAAPAAGVWILPEGRFGHPASSRAAQPFPAKGGSVRRCAGSSRGTWGGKTLLRAAVTASEGPCPLIHLRLWAARRDPAARGSGLAAALSRVAAPSGDLVKSPGARFLLESRLQHQVPTPELPMECSYYIIKTVQWTTLKRIKIHFVI